MSVEEKLRVIAECVRTLQGGEWSVREVLDIARVAGVCIREQEAYRLLYSLNLPGRRAAGKRRHATSRDNFIASEESATRASGSISKKITNASGDTASRASGSVSQSGREAFQLNSANASGSSPGSISGSISALARDLGSLGSLNLASLGSQAPLPSVAPLRSIHHRARTREEDTAWITGVLANAKAIAKVTIQAFTAEQRFDAGRYLAYKFANCTVSDRKNRRAGATFAKGLAGMAAAPYYGELTFGQYVALAKKLRANLNDAPFYDAWDVKSVVEWETA